MGPTLYKYNKYIDIDIEIFKKDIKTKFFL